MAEHICGAAVRCRRGRHRPALEDAAFRVNQRLAEAPDEVLDRWADEAARAAAARGVVGIVDLEMAWNPDTWTRRTSRGSVSLRVETGFYA